MPPSPPDPTLHAFGMHVRRMREAREMSVDELAARSGLSFRGVMYVEHGRRNPTLTTVLKLAAGLGQEPSSLLAVFDGVQPVCSDGGEDPTMDGP